MPIRLIFTGLLSICLIACEDTKKDKSGVIPQACRGEAKFDRPLGEWKATQFDPESGTKTLVLGIGTVATRISVSCQSGTLVADTSKVVGSDFVGEYYTLESTGVLEAKRPGIACRLSEMGGVYKLTFGGDCLILTEKSRSLYLQRF